MIYSKDHNFLLLRNFKVGSTSVEIELSKILPESATVTTMQDLNILKNNPEFKPRNHHNLYTHAGYDQIIKVLPMDNVKKYIIIRNPYEVVASYYFHILSEKMTISQWNTLSKKEKNKDVELYFENDWLKSSKWIYFYNNESIIDSYIRYENNIEDQLNVILSNHNLPNIKIQTFERQHRPKNITYKDIFSAKQLQIIADEWSWEFKNLGYKI